jgi:hypothetical protein
MALSESRLSGKIVDIIDVIKLEEEDYEDAKTKFANAIAKAFVEEIKQLKINYTSGLVAPNGAVTGTINATIS